MIKLNTLALRRRVTLFIIAAVTVMTITSCGGVTQMDESLTPGIPFDEQIRVINPFTQTDPDANGITGHAVVDGVKMEEGKYPTIVVPVGQEEIKASFAIDGHGFIRPGGVREFGKITDLYDTSTGKQEPLCWAKTSLASLPDVSSRLDILREQQETIRVEELRGKEDRELELAITLRADPIIAQRLAGRNSGIKEIPAERRVEIERTRTSPTSWLGLIPLALSFMDGGASQGLGVAEFLCGDPTVTLHAKVTIKGHGRDDVDPGPDPDPGPLNQPPTVSLTPSQVNINVGGTANFLATANDADGTIVLYEWDLDGDGQFETSGGNSKSRVYNMAGSFTVTVRVTDNDGAKASDTAQVTVVENATPPLMLGDELYNPATFYSTLTPEDVTIDVASKDTQQLGARLANLTPTNSVPIELWHYENNGWNAGSADPDSITQGGLWRGLISGNGTFHPYVWVVLHTTRGGVPEPTRVKVATSLTVIGN